MEQQSETQTTLYAESDADKVRRSRDARDKVLKIDRRIARNLDDRKALMRERRIAMTDFLIAGGGEHQMTLEEIEAQLEDEHDALVAKAAIMHQPPDPNTTQRRLERARKEVIEKALMVIRGAGGRLSNTALAQYIGQDAHGLAGYLDHCPQLRKEYVGRVSNNQCEWVLIQPEHGAA